MVPVIALTIGLIIKIALNLLLIPIEEIGIYGAIISSIASHIVSFIICFIYLKKKARLKLNPIKLIIKPVIAVCIMGCLSYITYIELIKNSYTMMFSFFISMILAVFVYGLALILFQIFSKEEIFMIPYGQKMYKFLKKIKIYKKD